MVKIERSFPAPQSLEIEKKKASGVYNKADVIDRLRKDFHNKCYICELNELHDPQVEHLKSHYGGRDLERKFDWNNLFWPCGHCNGVKNQRKSDEHILDCCQSDPEERITFEFYQGQTRIIANDIEDQEAKYTAELVTEVFNKRNTGMREYGSDFRFKELTREMNKLYDVLEDLEQHPDSLFAQNKLRAIVRRESRFAAFKRCYIRKNNIKYKGYL